MKKLNLILLILVLAVFQLSCTKKYGCMDTEAINYDPFADEYYPDCLYEFNVGFYLRENDSQQLLDTGCTFYYVFFDGEYIGSDYADHFIPNNTSVAKNVVIFYSDTVGVSDYYYADVEIRDQNSNTLYKYSDRFVVSEDKQYEQLILFE